jgi:tetratricopeptide (TPR) repeat protein
MEKALYWTDRDLHSTIRPRDSVYQLKLAELYQLGRYNETAELLELLVKMKPENKSYWQQLASSYQQLASTATDKHDDKAAYSYNIRIILAIERAQKLGIMNSPKDNYNLVGIYFNIGEFSEACRLLEQGLKEGSIERTRPNYELLANSYQQLHREYKAIETLKAATKVFPQSGQIEYQIAQVYFTIDKYKEAFEHMKICIAKGGTEKPHIGWLFYAYLALDLKEYDAALKGAGEAAKYPEAKVEAAKMEDAIKATLQDRENRLNSQ